MKSSDSINRSFRPSMNVGSILRGLGLGAFLLTGACSMSSSEGQVPGEGGLASVDIPKDFDFATARGVALSVVGTDNSQLGMTVALDNGAVLYQGPILAAPLKLSVPTKDSALVVKLKSEGSETEHRVQIVEGRAQLQR
jgi:hypothetical protein